jgi:hypothetical protein
MDPRVVALFGVLMMGVQDAKPPRLTEYNLVTLLGVTSLDGPVDPGGFDVKYRTGTYFLPSLAACGDQVGRTALTWSKERNLTILKSTISAGNVLLHLAVRTLPGFLEFTYDLNRERSEVRVKLLFIDEQARRQWPELTPALESLDIAKLGDRLKEAIACASAP